MTIQEAYGELGGNYEEMSYRINEKLLPRLISMLLKDSNYTDICTALEHCDYEVAYRGAHTLKGIALNLGLTPLAEKAGALTETLRDREENINIGPAFSEFKQEYENMAAVFSQLPVLSGGNAQ